MVGGAVEENGLVPSSQEAEREAWEKRRPSQAAPSDLLFQTSSHLPEVYSALNGLIH